MAEFFAALLAETDPTRLAGMAEALPEPPTFDQHHPNDEVVGSLDLVEPVETPEAIDRARGHLDLASPEPPEATFDDAAETGADGRRRAWPPLASPRISPPASAEAAEISMRRRERPERRDPDHRRGRPGVA
ncbi:MAG: hypothetical protein WKF78_03915 [Candidatus Limnocylindrales bacterium]